MLGEVDHYNHVGNIQQPIRIKQEPPDMYMGQQYGNQPGPSNSKVSQLSVTGNTAPIALSGPRGSSLFL